MTPSNLYSHSLEIAACAPGYGFCVAAHTVTISALKRQNMPPKSAGHPDLKDTSVQSNYDEDYRPVYELVLRAKMLGISDFDAAQDLLAKEWERTKGRSRLTWSQAKHVVRSAWRNG